MNKIKITSSGLFILFSTTLFAQQKPYVIHRDTINIHGYVYDHTGKPVKLLHIQSTQLETAHNSFKVGGYTDVNGYFELKGAKLYDTLTIGPDIHYDIPQYYNKDSRYLLIYLPPAKVTDINSATPIVVVQKRKYPKIVPSFNIQPITDVGNDTNASEPAQYPGGINELESYIEKNISYPQNAVKNNVEGTVQIGFMIDKNGNHTGYKILRGIGYGCDEEVIRTIRRSPKWKPAIDNGVPATAEETISIQFKLTDNLPN